MNIAGNTVLFVNGRASRVCGRRFNKIVKAYEYDLSRAVALLVQLPSGEKLIPSKGLSWVDVAKQVRAGKKVQAAAVRV